LAAGWILLMPPHSLVRSDHRSMVWARTCRHCAAYRARKNDKSSMLTSGNFGCCNSSFMFCRPVLSPNCRKKLCIIFFNMMRWCSPVFLLDNHLAIVFDCWENLCHYEFLWIIILQLSLIFGIAYLCHLEFSIILVLFCSNVWSCNNSTARTIPTCTLSRDIINKWEHSNLSINRSTYAIFMESMSCDCG
jgi:hypothetical protein